MLSSLQSWRVSRSSVEAISDHGEDEGRLGRVLRAKISDPAFSGKRVVVVKVLRSIGTWNGEIRVGFFNVSKPESIQYLMPKPPPPPKALIHELNTWGGLRHPNILPFGGFDFDESSPAPSACVMTHWQPNGDVVSYLKNKRPRMDVRIALVSHGSFTFWTSRFKSCPGRRHCSRSRLFAWPFTSPLSWEPTSGLSPQSRLVIAIDMTRSSSCTGECNRRCTRQRTDRRLRINTRGHGSSQ